MTVTLDGLHPTLMRPRVEAMLADPEAKAIGMYLVSAFRSVDLQRQLFADAVKKYGSEAAASKWVAPPGKSNHGPRVDGFGTAVDVGIPGHIAVQGQWPADLETKVNAIAARHGLQSPMDWEDWHFEPIPNWNPPEDIVTEQDKQDIVNRVVEALAGPAQVDGSRLNLVQVLADIQGSPFKGEKFDLCKLAAWNAQLAKPKP